MGASWFASRSTFEKSAGQTQRDPSSWPLTAKHSWTCRENSPAQRPGGACSGITLAVPIPTLTLRQVTPIGAVGGDSCHTRPTDMLSQSTSSTIPLSVQASLWNQAHTYIPQPLSPHTHTRASPGYHTGHPHTCLPWLPHRTLTHVPPLATTQDTHTRASPGYHTGHSHTCLPCTAHISL